MLAIAMLFGPLGLSSGRAMAMAPVADQHIQMMESGHCDDQPGKDTQSDTKSCCVSMCSAIAVEPTTAFQHRALAPLPVRPSLAQFDPGFLAKLPTPPPRLA